MSLQGDLSFFVGVWKALVGERRAEAINVMNASNRQRFERFSVPHGENAAADVIYKINDDAAGLSSCNCEH